VNGLNPKEMSVISLDSGFKKLVKRLKCHSEDRCIMGVASDYVLPISQHVKHHIRTKISDHELCASAIQVNLLRVRDE